jgi:Ca-activated chloride channel family protein
VFVNGTYFEIDIWALMLVALLIVTSWFSWHWMKTFASPKILFSNLNALQTQSKPWRTYLAKWPQFLQYAALGLFLIAFLDPRLQILKEGNANPARGIAIYLVADRSGSMAEKSNLPTNRRSTSSLSKVDTLKQVTTKFVQGDPALKLAGRPNDLIGLVAFSRTPQVLVPLTLDHKAIIDALAKINVAKDKAEDGTAMGYAIFKTVNYIDATRHYSGSGIPPYEIKSAIIILVTDGIQEANPLDEGKRLRNMGIMEAAEYAKEKDVKLYIVNVEPAFDAPDFEPFRNQFEKATELTGGKFYMTASGTSLDQIYSSIDALEKSEISQVFASLPMDQQPHHYRRVSFYPFLIASGMLLLLIATILNTTLLRRVP